MNGQQLSSAGLPREIHKYAYEGMRLALRTIFWVFVIVLFTSNNTVYANETDKEAVIRLEKENVQLREEVSRLRSAIKLLQRDIIDSRNKSKSKTDNKEEQKEEIRTLKSLNEIIDSISEDSLPADKHRNNPDAWGEINRQLIEESLRKIRGTPIQITVKVGKPIPHYGVDYVETIKGNANSRTGFKTLDAYGVPILPENISSKGVVWVVYGNVYFGTAEENRLSKVVSGSKVSIDGLFNGRILKIVDSPKIMKVYQDTVSKKIYVQVYIPIAGQSISEEIK